MAKYRTQLPQLDGGIYLTDSGLETTLAFTDGLELEEFAAFELLNDTDGRERLYNYFARHAKIAKENKTGFILDSVTWRASSAWGIKLDYSEEDLEEINLKSIEILERVRNDFEGQSSKFVISGCLGPHGDGYKPTEKLSIQEAETYHARQIETFSKSNADMVTAFTMTYSEEAIGIVRAAAYIGMPVVISFTVETDGKLPSGETLLVHDLLVVRLDRLTGGGQVVEGNAWVHVVGNVHEDNVEEHVEESRNVEICGAGDLALELAP